MYTFSYIVSIFKTSGRAFVVIKDLLSGSIMAPTSSLTGLHDIFYHILSHLAPDLKHLNITFLETFEEVETRKALARLARTHSSFTQPALAEMWRSLPSQRPLEHLPYVVGIAQGSSGAMR